MLDKGIHLEKYKIDIIFISDDWKGSERWNKTEKELSKVGISVKYIPCTKTISTTIIKESLK